MNTRFDPELSRLAFEDRVIEFCEDERVPLLDRVRLLGILGERMDVFFMTRVGRLKRMHSRGEQAERAPATPQEQLVWVTREANRMMRRAYSLLDALLGALKEHDIGIEQWDDLTDAERDHVRRELGSKLRACVGVTVVEEGSSLPHVRNLRPALVAPGRRLVSGAPCLLIAELPDDLPRLVPLPRERHFVPVEQVIAAELATLRPDLDVEDAYLFRVTRNASTEIDDDDDVLSDFVEEIVRRPFQEVVRIEVEERMPERLRKRLLEQWAHEADAEPTVLAESDCYSVPGLLDLTALDALASLELPKLKCPPMKRRATSVDHLLDADAGKGDVLLHFPFDDYETSVERFLHDAARHPDLESIQTTIYRTDEQSDVVEALLAARARGAEVNAIVELKASFDERDNIALTRVLHEAGVRVVLSPVSLKVHAKTALVTFGRNGVRRRVALIGTGNMNARTSRSYIDLWLATADPDITDDLAELFDVLTGASTSFGFDTVFVSPFEMRRRFLRLIEAEIEHAGAGRPSGIRAMMNGLTDPTIIAALHRASQAGVSVDLMVRGVCLLRPRTPDISENIRIVSLAGQLLQHARIFHFRNGGDDRWLIGSADWRPRNFDARVEVVTGVQGAEHQAMLDTILTGTLEAPDAWELGADGVYVRRGMLESPCVQGIQT